MLETSNLARKHTPIFTFKKYTFQCLGPLKFPDVSIFLQKISVFFQKSTFTQNNSVRAVLEIFQFCFQFLYDKRLLLLKTYLLQTLCSESGLWTAPNWPKITKMTLASQFSDMTSTSIFFQIFLFLLSNLVTDPSFMSIS